MNNIKGHIILYCKGHYYSEGISFITGLQRIWAVRCGYGIDCIDRDSLEYIADELFNILIEINPNLDIVRFQKRLHNEISKTYLDRWKGLSTIEQLIMFYSSEIMQVEVRKYIGNNRYKNLIKLPTKKARLFKRILEGNFSYEDSKLINE